MNIKQALITFILSALVWATAYGVAQASGDQNRDKNPVIDDEGNIIGVVDPNVNCEMYVAPQSGKIVYFCDED